MDIIQYNTLYLFTGRKLATLELSSSVAHRFSPATDYGETVGGNQEPSARRSAVAMLILGIASMIHIDGYYTWWYPQYWWSILYMDTVYHQLLIPSVWYPSIKNDEPKILILIHIDNIDGYYTDYQYWYIYGYYRQPIEYDVDIDTYWYTSSPTSISCSWDLDGLSSGPPEPLVPTVRPLVVGSSQVPEIWAVEAKNWGSWGNFLIRQMVSFPIKNGHWFWSEVHSETSSGSRGFS